MFATVHLAPVWAISGAVALVSLIVWYWRVLSRRKPAASQLWIRRVSMVLMVALIPPLVAALSYLDPTVTEHKRSYVHAWMWVVGGLLLVIICAIVDAVNNLRLVDPESDE